MTCSGSQIKCCVISYQTLDDSKPLKEIPRPGIEPGSSAWQADILTTILTRITTPLKSFSWTPWTPCTKCIINKKPHHALDDLQRLANKVQRHFVSDFRWLEKPLKQIPRPGIEPGSSAWQADILTTILRRMIIATTLESFRWTPWIARSKCIVNKVPRHFVSCLRWLAATRK